MLEPSETVLIFLTLSLPAGLPMFIKNPLAPDTQMQVNIAAAASFLF